MKNTEEIKNTAAKDYYYIGERLKVIREDIKEKDEVQDKRKSEFSIKNVAERLGIDYSTMTNIERGSISSNTFKLILYYYTLGYNPMWIIVLDNEFLPMQNLGENLIYQDDVRDRFKELESVVGLAMKNFKSNI